VIWKNQIDLALINQMNGKCLPGHLGIDVVEVGDDYIKASMPIDHRTMQPMGLLHGGASAALSETLGSIASLLAAGPFGSFSVVGIEINANHLKSGKSGTVFGITKPVKLGKTLHVWNTEIYDENDDLLCISRLTVMIKPL
jgi:1,4-dihydroxy-2-naphthoyl-CoA hydrolase